MTTTDLKNNRNEIITYLNEHSGDVKLVMTKMVTFVEMYDSWEKLADYIIESYNLEKALFFKNTLWGAGCKYSTQSEYQRSKLGNKHN